MTARPAPAKRGPGGRNPAQQRAAEDGPGPDPERRGGIDGAGHGRPRGSRCERGEGRKGRRAPGGGAERGGGRGRVAVEGEKREEPAGNGEGQERESGASG